MGYESRVFIVNRIEYENAKNELCVFAEKIADIKMSKMYSEFVDLFDKEIDYELYVDSIDESTKVDRYGNVMTYTNCETVINYLEELIANGENYRRLNLLLGLLKGFDENHWDDIQVVHYGY